MDADLILELIMVSQNLYSVSSKLVNEGARKAWQPPRIEDADISALTAGIGTSGIEGPSFLKAGS